MWLAMLVYFVFVDPTNNYWDTGSYWDTDIEKAIETLEVGGSRTKTNNKGLYLREANN